MEHIHVAVDEILFFSHKVIAEGEYNPEIITIRYKHDGKILEVAYKKYVSIDHVSSIIEKGNTYKQSNVEKAIDYIEPKVQRYVYESPDDKVTVYSNVDPTVKELD